MRVHIGFVILDKRFRKQGLLVPTGKERRGDRVPKIYRTAGYAEGAVTKAGFERSNVEIVPAFISIPKDPE